MAKNIDDKLVLAISSRALFDLSESHKVYLSSGVEAYRQYQIEHEDEILAPGDAFPLVEKLLKLNSRLGRARVEVILVSRNSADTGLRVFNSIHHYGLAISRAAFVGGRSPYPYLKAFGCDLFLSTHAEDVRAALDAGFAAATILSGGASRAASDELRIAFDGDAVIFSDESERVYQSGGLEAFQAKESVSRLASRCAVGRSRAFWRRSICCSASFPMTIARSARRWSLHVRRRPMSG
jgi:5'-nucleotidase